MVVNLSTEYEVFVFIFMDFRVSFSHLVLVFILLVDCTYEI